MKTAIGTGKSLWIKVFFTSGVKTLAKDRLQTKPPIIC
jgi:hypothetical protein